jgi:histidyl-tRNA synthetase
LSDSSATGRQSKSAAKPRKFQAIKGVRDLLPAETPLWNHVEETAHAVFGTFGFSEIRLPIFEPTELFARSIGLDTDVVSKEMYTFEDFDTSELLEYRNAIITWHDRAVTEALAGPLGIGSQARFQPFFDLIQKFFILGRESFANGIIPRTPENDSFLRLFEGEVQEFQVSIGSHTDDESRKSVDQLKERIRHLKFGDLLTLRPEATASVCRAYIEHNMQQLPQPVKLYYMGPMFRRERPQKGRYRQFYQIGAEVLGGNDSPGIDAEVIDMVMTFFDKLELQGLELDINSIGCRECRPKYVEVLRAALIKVKDKLGPDSQRRIETNPLRVLDSKLPNEQEIIATLPRMAEHLCDDCAEHFAEVKRQLELRGVIYRENWRLVRGLDYYMRTTFEITAQGLGSQNAVCGGGRYDGLVELLGGPPTKGIGFAIGEDRLILSLQESGSASAPTGPDVYVAWMGEKAFATAIRAAKDLRAAGYRVELPATEQKFGKALGQADKLGARYALILGEDEVTSGEWTLKTLSDGSQKKYTESELLAYLREPKPAAQQGT